MPRGFTAITAWCGFWLQLSETAPGRTIKMFNLLFDFRQRLAEASVLHGASPMTCEAGENRPECNWATAAASNPRDFLSLSHTCFVFRRLATVPNSLLVCMANLLKSGVSSI